MDVGPSPEPFAQPPAPFPPSPLTGARADVSLVRAIDPAQLVEGYRRRLGVDVSALFAGVDRMRLLHDRATGLSFFDPPVVGDEAFYAALSRRPGYHRADKAEFRIAAPHVPPGASVLEVGAGAGHFADLLDGADYLGLEFNPAAAEAARARGVRVQTRDVLDMAAQGPGGGGGDRGGHRGGDRFDVTCAFQVLEHVADPLSMIAAMAALTRPGGRMILATPNAGAYVSRCRDLLNAPPHHVTWWEDRTWRWVAEAFGMAGVALFHTPIDEMLGAWAQMVAADGTARQLGLELDPVVDETPLRRRVDEMAAPLARTILAGLAHRGDVPEAGHTTVAVFTLPAGA